MASGPTRQQTFCYPLKDLENDRLLLTVFDPDVHAAQWVAAQAPHPQLFTYMPFGPFPDVDAFLTKYFNPRIIEDHNNCLFAIFDKATSKLAGTVGYLNSEAEHLKTEIGFIAIVPEFQRTHVSSNAIGLLLHYALDLPERGGLGLRRVQWQANLLNQASVRAAERMGFVLEGVRRWERMLPPGKESNLPEVRKGDPREDWPGRHSAMLAMCWDDWEMGGVREKVDAMMNRKS